MSVSEKIKDAATALVGDPNPDVQRILSGSVNTPLSSLDSAGIARQLAQHGYESYDESNVLEHAVRLAHQSMGGARRASPASTGAALLQATATFMQQHPDMIADWAKVEGRGYTEKIRRLGQSLEAISKKRGDIKSAFDAVQEFGELEPAAKRGLPGPSAPPRAVAKPKPLVSSASRPSIPTVELPPPSAETASLLSGIPELRGDPQESVYARPFELGTDQRPVAIKDPAAWDAYKELLEKFELEEYLEDAPLMQKFATDVNLLFPDKGPAPLSAEAFSESNPNWSVDRQLFFVEQAKTWLGNQEPAPTYDELLSFMQRPYEAPPASGALAQLSEEDRADLFYYLYAVWWASTNQLLTNAEERAKLDRATGNDPAKLAERYQRPLDAVEMNNVRGGMLRGNAVLNQIFQGDKRQHVVWGELSKAIMKASQDPVLQNSYGIKECDLQTMHLSAPQRFILKYFKHTLPIKGMLLWWSVGQGKTCAGVSLASVNFDPAGWYTLWVTKKSLRAPIYEAIFTKTRCHAVLNEKGVFKGLSAKPSLDEQEKLLVNNSRWIETTSYEQLSNWCDPNPAQLQVGRRRSFISRMVANGDDPKPLDADRLYKTLIAVDEAQFLFDKSKMEKERVRVEYIKDAIYKSYEISGMQSCRLLFFTATPLLRHPMDFVNLINLMQPDPTMRVSDEKGKEYTDEDFDRFYLVDQKLAPGSPARIEAETRSREFVETMIMPKLFRNMYGKISYVNTTGMRPMFPGFTSAQTVYVPVSKLQIADALHEGAKGAQMDGDCTLSGPDDTLKVARCMKRVDLATQAFREFALSDATMKTLKENQEFFRKYLVQFSPKLTAMLNMIQEYNRQDWTKHGHLFKMVVYLPFENPLFTQVVMSVFRLYNYGLGVWFKPDGMKLVDRPLSPREMDPFAPEPGVYAPNMACIVQGTINGYKMRGSIKEAEDDPKKAGASDYNLILEMFNRRSKWSDDGKLEQQGNEYGEWAQILVVSGPFREGIDVFDCKRFFQITPEESVQDGMQALGRVQRRCGNRGLIERALRERAAKLGQPPQPLRAVPADDPLVMEMSSMDYIEFRSYLPQAIVNPRTKEESKVAALDEINRESFSAGFFIENLSSNPALNRWNIAPGPSEAPVDDPLEPGRAFKGTQKEFLERFYKAWTRGDDISRSALVGKYAIKPEVLRSQFLSPLVYAGSSSNRVDKPLVRAGYAPGAASPKGRGRGRAAAPRRYGGRRPRASVFGASYRRPAGSKGKFAVAQSTPLQLRHALLKGLSSVGQNEIDAFVEKYEVQGPPQRWIMDELYLPELAKEVGRYSKINNHILTSAAVLSVDYWLMRNDSDPMYSPPDIVTMITAKTAKGVPVQKLGDDGRMMVATDDVPRPLQSKPDVEELTTVVVPDYTGQFNKHYKVEDLPEAQQKAEEETRAAKASKDLLEASKTVSKTRE